ncbi:MAG: cysteine dioxygenase family protein [Fimbriimonadaceae bacterium]|nr:cysteine dioxygenase family protein [Fimbriimonadaceae bacterium]
MATQLQTEKVNELIRRLDEAVGMDAEPCCHRVKDVLHDLCTSGIEFIDEPFLQPVPDRYARRLFHKDPQGRYSVLIMVWGKGQGTPLHDHAHMWCVECVYRGEIKVVSYSLKGSDEDALVQFDYEQEILAGRGDAGALIPPFEYHTIENAGETPAVTIHVYGGEMEWCHAFIPVEGGYKREERKLCYTPMG